MDMWTPHRIGLLVGPKETRIFDSRAGTATVANLELQPALKPLKSAFVQLDVVLCDTHCRYAVLDRPRGLRNRGELNAAMRSRFRAIFGNIDAWQVATAPAPGSVHDFVVGIDARMAEEIQNQCSAAGMRVATIRPHWVAWARHFRAKTRKGNHWLIAADGHWVSVGYLRDGECVHVRTLRLDSEPVDVEALIARERALVCDADPAARTWLCGEKPSFDPASLSTGALSGIAEPEALWRRNGLKA